MLRWFARRSTSSADGVPPPRISPPPPPPADSRLLPSLIFSFLASRLFHFIIARPQPVAIAATKVRRWSHDVLIIEYIYIIYAHFGYLHTPIDFAMLITCPFTYILRAATARNATLLMISLDAILPSFYHARNGQGVNEFIYCRYAIIQSYFSRYCRALQRPPSPAAYAPARAGCNALNLQRPPCLASSQMLITRSKQLCSRRGTID